jgi:hypothetical protein
VLINEHAILNFLVPGFNASDYNENNWVFIYDHLLNKLDNLQFKVAGLIHSAKMCSTYSHKKQISY